MQENTITRAQFERIKSALSVYSVAVQTIPHTRPSWRDGEETVNPAAWARFSCESALCCFHLLNTLSEFGVRLNRSTLLDELAYAEEDDFNGWTYCAALTTYGRDGIELELPFSD